MPRVGTHLPDVAAALSRLAPVDRTDAGLRHPLALAAIAVSLLACVANIVGTALDVEWLRAARWLYTPPLVLTLAAVGAMRDRRAWWWAAGLLLSWVGDTQGGRGFLVLLGAFLVAHLCYLVALWPTRRASLLGRPAALVHLAVLAAGLVVIVPAVDAGLAVAVVAYGAVLTLMAVLATAGGPAGLAGGLLFMVSDLVLAVGIFVIDLPDAVQTLVVIGTYVPAQVLLVVALVRLVRSDPTRVTPAPARG